MPVPTRGCFSMNYGVLRQICLPEVVDVLSVSLYSEGCGDIVCFGIQKIFFAANSAPEKLTCFTREGTVWLRDRRMIYDQ